METDKKVIAVLGKRVEKALLARDTFADVDGTALTAHEMDVGAGWERIGDPATYGSYFDIQGNRAHKVPAASGSQWARAVTETGESDVIITYDAIIAGGTASNHVITRLTDANNFIFCVFGDVNITISEYNAGIATTRAATSHALPMTNGLVYQLEAIISKESIKFQVVGEGVATNWDTAAFNKAATKHGIFSSAGATVEPLFDNFQVTTI